MCELVGKADLLSDHFDSKQSREAVDLSLTCNFCNFMQLPLMGAPTHWVCSAEFLAQWARTADVLALLMGGKTADASHSTNSVVLRRLVRLDSSPVCWRQANVTPIPKGPPSTVLFCCQLPTDFHNISILSKMFERLVLVRHGRFMEHSGLLPTIQFAYWKGLGTCDALCACPIHCKVHWRVSRRLV